MFTCDKCGKSYEKERQLIGHKPHCKAGVPDVKAEPVSRITGLETGRDLKVQEPQYRYDLYHELPPPVIDWLKINFGGWLNHFEVGRTEYRTDFGGYGVYIKVPREYSTEWREEEREVYDNRTRAPARDEKGNPIRFKHVTPDVRYVSLQLEMPKVLNLLDRIKNHIIENAHSKGIRLPSIGEEVASTKSLEAYKQSLYK